MAVRIFSRQELLDLVWSAPMRSVAAELGLSDVGLKKAVVKAGIPTPPQGHWNRVAAGKKAPPKPALPPRKFGASDQIQFGSSPWYNAQPDYPIDEPPPPAPEFEESLEAVRVRAAKAVGKIAVARDLKAAHPAIRQILADEEARAEKVRASRWSSSWDQPRFTAPLDQRRLRLLNAVCLGVAKAGLRASLWGKEFPVISIAGDDASVPVIVQKMVMKGKNAETDKRLSIIAGKIPDQSERILRRWDDPPEGKLEAIITDVAVDLVVLVEEQFRAERMRRHEWRLEHREQCIEKARLARLEAERKERERREALEQARIDRLLQDADQLQKAQLIRQYVAEVGRHLEAAPAPAAAAFKDWSGWALAQADRIDPVRNGSFLERIEDEDMDNENGA